MRQTCPPYLPLSGYPYCIMPVVTCNVAAPSNKTPPHPPVFHADTADREIAQPGMGTHLLNEAQGDRFYRFTGISGNTRFTVNDRHTDFLIKIDIVMDLTVLIAAMPSAPPRRRQRHFAHITDIRRHLRQHWQREPRFTA